MVGKYSIKTNEQNNELITKQTNKPLGGIFVARFLLVIGFMSASINQVMYYNIIIKWQPTVS